MVAEERTAVKPLDAKLVAMAQYLKQRAVRDPRWGTAFIRALDRGLVRMQQGLVVERYNAAYWIAPSATQEFVRYHVNRWHCGCEAGKQGKFCWHRAMVILHSIEAEFDAVHGLNRDADEDEDRTPDCAPSYRVTVELRLR
jgi:hypothetical protein